MQRSYRGTTGDLLQDEQARSHLAESNFDKMCSVYQRAAAHGAESFVVLVLDCADVLGNQLARLCLGHDRIEAELSARDGGSQPGATMTLVIPTDYEATREGLLATFPELEADFTPPAPDNFLAVIVTAGGASVAEITPA